MLFLLSPAKSLDYQTPVAAEVQALATRPRFVPQAAALIERLRACSASDLAGLMDLSESLARLNVARYAAWSTRFSERNSKPAVLAFNGDVYDGLQAGSLGLDDLAWAQQHLAILSGLYGLLRPLDRLQPYRLEMGTRLDNAAAPDLYGYWGPQITEHLNQRQSREARPVLVNLASQEYFKVVRRADLRARVVTCHFQDWHQGQWKTIGFHAKRARGMMARHAVLRRARAPEDLIAFGSAGYAHDGAASGPDDLVFRRRNEPAWALTAESGAAAESGP